MKRLLPIYIILLFCTLTIGAFLLYQNNECTVGGITGKQCDCIGVKLLKSKDNFPDGFEYYACLGLIRPT